MNATPEAQFKAYCKFMGLGTGPCKFKNLAQFQAYYKFMGLGPGSL